MLSALCTQGTAGSLCGRRASFCMCKAGLVTCTTLVQHLITFLQALKQAQAACIIAATAMQAEHIGDADIGTNGTEVVVMIAVHVVKPLHTSPNIGDGPEAVAKTVVCIPRDGNTSGTVDALLEVSAQQKGGKLPSIASGGTHNHQVLTAVTQSLALMADENVARMLAVVQSLRKVCRMMLKL